MRRARPARNLARTTIQRFAYAAIGMAASVRRATLPSRVTVDVPERVLIIRLDLLGDVAFTLPLAEALRHSYPNCRITMLTLPYTAPLARSCRAVNEVVTVDTNRIRTLRGLLSPRTWIGYWSTLRHLRCSDFDLCISAYGQMGSLWAWLAAPCQSVGFRQEAYPGTLSHPLEGGRHRERMHEVEYIRRLASAAGATWFPQHLSLPVDQSAEDRVSALLAARGIGPEDRVVAIHTGSINGAAKRWPARYWARFADALQRTTGARVVLIGAGSDEVIARQVRDEASLPMTSLAGQTDVTELVAMLARADLVATGDSGPLHLAVALQRPLLCVYGPTDPEIYGPYRPSAPVALHRADIPCSPCYTLAASAECPLGYPICMDLVTVAQMVDSALELLGEERAAIRR